MFLFSLAAEGGLCGPVRFEQRLSPLSPLFISLFSFIHIHSANTATLYTGKRSREEAQNPFPKTARLAAKSVCVYQDPYVGEGRWAAYTHTHTPQVQSANQITRLATLQFAGVRSVSGDSQRSRLCLALPTCFCVRQSDSQSSQRSRLPPSSLPLWHERFTSRLQPSLQQGVHRLRPHTLCLR